MDQRDDAAQLKTWILWTALAATLTISGVLVRLWLADLDGKLKYHLDEIAFLRGIVATNTRTLSVMEATQRRADQDRLDMEARIRQLCKSSSHRSC